MEMEKKRKKKVKKKNGIFLLVSVSGLITKAFFFQDSGNPYIDKKSVSLPVTRSHSSIKVYTCGASSTWKKFDIDEKMLIINKNE